MRSINGNGADAGKRPGVGIRNVRERLQQFYGDDHACTLGQATPHGLKVNIRVPLETAGATG